MLPNATLSNPDRLKARTFLATLPNWLAYRAVNGLNISQVSSSSQVWQIASDLNATDTLCAYMASNAVETETETAKPAKVETETETETESETQQALQNLLAVLGKNKTPTVDLSEVMARIHETERRLKDVESRDLPTRIVTVDRNKVEVGRVEGLHHESFETLLELASLRDPEGFRFNIWLAGPAGSGKTTAARNCAKALGLQFGFHGSMADPSELLGYCDANGDYHSTQFVELFSNGGLCLLDECDSGSETATLAINAALANGLMSLPDGRIVKRHPAFCCIGAGNTFGKGATAEYSGRTKLDGAFMSRFHYQMAWNYDLKLELAMTNNSPFTVYVQKARVAAKAQNLKVSITPRHSQAGAALIANGATFERAAKLTFLAGLSSEDCAKLAQNKV